MGCRSHDYSSPLCLHGRSGSHLDPQCPEDSRKLSAEAAHYLVIDTNVALHQVRAAQPSP
jgi:hypothetical protein